VVSENPYWQRPADVGLSDAIPFSVYPKILLGDFDLSVPLREATTGGVGSRDFRAPVRTYLSVFTFCIAG
jgi:hypothetical protein